MSLEGVPIHLVDTAGLREANEEVERIGIERAWSAVRSAGAVVLIESPGEGGRIDAALEARLPSGVPIARVTNKIDLTGERAGREGHADAVRIRLSAKTGEGVSGLRDWLLEVAGWQPHGEGLFMARERHLVALRAAEVHLEAAGSQQAFELQAEELRLAQLALAAITGEVSADQLLGEIFSRFCIGK